MKKRPILDVAQVVELERRIAQAGTPLSELMDRAGAAVADAARRLAEEVAAARRAPHEALAREACVPLPVPDPPMVLVLCGSGNNGGDGWVAARILAEAGLRIVLMASCAPDEIKAQPAHDAAVEAFRVLDAAERCHVFVRPDCVLLHGMLGNADAVIDAILGTGFSGAQVREPYSWWIQVANEHRPEDVRVVSVDVPSGLSAQTGEAANFCIAADLTVTMIVQKTGLALPGAARYCGEVETAPLVPLEEAWLDGLK